MTESGNLLWWQHLSVRLSAGVFGVLCLALLTAGIWLSHEEEQRFQEQNRVYAAQISKMVASALSERMLAGGGAAVWKDVARLAEELRSATGTARIQVMSRAGLVKASTDAQLVGHQYLIDANVECTACHRETMRDFPRALSLNDGGKSLLRVISPIPKLPACSHCHQKEEAFRGMIAIDFDHSSVEAASQQRNRLFFTIAVAAGTLMFGLIYILLRLLVTRPVEQLSTAAEQMGQGNLGTRAVLRHQDEIGELTLHFNDMAGRIQKQFDALEVSTLELNLLYTLVVEVSRNMELTQVQSTVLNILRDRLNLGKLAFCVEISQDTWNCMAFNEQGEETQVVGHGPVNHCILRETSECRDLMPSIPMEIILDATDRRQLTQQVVNGEWTFVMPFVFANQLVGLLTGSAQESSSKIADDKLLSNIAVHVGLALDNSRNYTQAITDSLTGFRNKRYGLSRLDEAIYRAERYKHPLALAMLDIDHFKRVNDTLGHQVGDDVLRGVAQRLQNASRKSDLLVRYGGEEFMILFPYTGNEHLAGVGEKLRASVAGQPIPYGHNGASLDVTLSIGMALFIPGQDNGEALISRADRALYRAKETGRNRVIIDT